MAEVDGRRDADRSLQGYEREIIEHGVILRQLQGAVEASGKALGEKIDALRTDVHERIEGVRGEVRANKAEQVLQNAKIEARMAPLEKERERGEGAKIARRALLAAAGAIVTALGALGAVAAQLLTGGGLHHP